MNEKEQKKLQRKIERYKRKKQMEENKDITEDNEI